MKTEKKIVLAFILNLAFSFFEFFGGFFTGSVAIISDATHDLGDALSIGISYFLEKKSKRKPDKKYTYGYLRFSVLGGLITTLILIIGSVFVIYNAINKMITPSPIYYNGMIFFAIIGIIINFIATLFTHEGKSLNQKAVNLHMLEDLLGWIVVLVGGVIIKYTKLDIIDPIMSICVAIFILISSIKNLTQILSVFLDKVPKEIDIEEIVEHILNIEGVKDIHHVHVWSLDGENNLATMHVVADVDSQKIKSEIKEELKEHGVCHSVIELEKENENCQERTCQIESNIKHCHCHHQH